MLVRVKVASEAAWELKVEVTRERPGVGLGVGQELNSVIFYLGCLSDVQVAVSGSICVFMS